MPPTTIKMEEMCCEICHLDFEGISCIPRMLRCGHSLCSTCLDKIIRINPTCPKCRDPIPGKCVDYPINYAVLAIVNAYNSNKSMNCKINHRLRVLQNKFTTLHKRLEKHSSQIEDALNYIKKLGKGHTKEHKDDMNKVIDQLESTYKKIGEKSFEESNPKINVSLTLEHSKDTEEYLKEIYHILQGTRKVYSVARVGKALRYGQITSENNLLLIHALDLERNSELDSSVWFNNFKKCLNSKYNLSPFLKLSWGEKGIVHLLQIELFTCQLVPQFVKLCTGEAGPSYKGASFKRDNDKIVIEKYMNKVAGNIDYFGKKTFASESLKRSKAFQRKTDEIIVWGLPNGRIEVAQNFSLMDFDNAIGRVKNKLNFKDLIAHSDKSNLKVVDCGFMFEL